jgi:hypothetical protein
MKDKTNDGFQCLNTHKAFPIHTLNPNNGIEDRTPSCTFITYFKCWDATSIQKQIKKNASIIIIP